MIQTERLTIHIASDDEMRDFIAVQEIDVLREAYTEMLNGALAHPNERVWYAMWMIELRDGTHVGELCFKGISPDGAVEIGYGIDERYQGHGYATEAVSAVTAWAAQQEGISRIEAEAEEDNIASLRVLEKSGFVPTGERGEEGSRFVWKNKQ